MQEKYGTAFLAFGMGIQNALCTTFSGAVVRTTHMTGMVTDLSVVLGKSIRARKCKDAWKLWVFVPMVLSFMLGSYLGAVGFSELGNKALYVAAGVIGGTNLKM
jgi:uncharacterized membrane protein YoaK (UPF0700 family)